MSPNGGGTLAPSSRLPSPTFKSQRKSCVRKFERCCCNTIIYFPLVFVYGLTSWAVWVQASLGLIPSKSAWIGYGSAFVGIIFYLLLNWSYTTAVFTDPGSPLTQTTNAYSVVPTDEEEEEEQTGFVPEHTAPAPDHTSVTVKSTGEARYCKKCHSRKPDRAHHCSTCRRCVLKMDHHCPWLATCVGLRNYKPFLLFLIYTSLFCWHCFAVTGSWVWNEIFEDTSYAKSDRLMPVNSILLAVLSGIIALVLSGFTSWHLYLVYTGQTTIESLEKTRYVAPLRRAMQFNPHQNPNNYDSRNQNQTLPNFAAQLREIHANALPGITRPEEGVSPYRPSTPLPESQEQNHHQLGSSPAHASLRKNLVNDTPSAENPYTPAAEARREQARYAAYLDELDASKLPNAFDLGWRRNLAHVFGPSPSLWLIPVCNTTGDGWTWEASRKWVERRDELAREREARAREDAAFARERWETMRAQRPGPRQEGELQPSIGGSAYRAGDESTSSDNAEDEDEDDLPLSRRVERLQHQKREQSNWGREGSTAQWNDIPDDILAPLGSGRTSRTGARSRGSPVGR